MLYCSEFLKLKRASRYGIPYGTNMRDNRKGDIGALCCRLLCRLCFHVGVVYKYGKKKGEEKENIHTPAITILLSLGVISGT